MTVSPWVCFKVHFHRREAEACEWGEERVGGKGEGGRDLPKSHSASMKRGFLKKWGQEEQKDELG